MNRQTEFTESLLDPKRAVPDGLVDPEGRPAPKRFAVYRNNVVHSLIGALSDAYPAVRANVGDAFFEAMAGLYVRQNPPTSPMIMFYGEAFPEFLRNFKPATERAFLPELAELERLMRQCYHGADDKAFRPEDLSEILEERLMETRFKPRASSALLATNTPALSYWMYLLQGANQPVENQQEYILITRPELDIAAFGIDPAQFQFFQELVGGQTLEQAYEIAASQDDAFDLGAALGLALQSSFFTSAI